MFIDIKTTQLVPQLVYNLIILLFNSKFCHMLVYLVLSDMRRSSSLSGAWLYPRIFSAYWMSYLGHRLFLLTCRFDATLQHTINFILQTDSELVINKVREENTIVC